MATKRKQSRKRKTPPKTSAQGAGKKKRPARAGTKKSATTRSSAAGLKGRGRKTSASKKGAAERAPKKPAARQSAPKAAPKKPTVSRKTRIEPAAAQFLRPHRERSAKPRPRKNPAKGHRGKSIRSPRPITSRRRSPIRTAHRISATLMRPSRPMRSRASCGSTAMTSSSSPGLDEHGQKNSANRERAKD